MTNPIYQQYSGSSDMDAFMKQFQQFQSMFKGNPQQIIQQMLNSGRITQADVNNAIQRVNQIQKMMK